MLWRRFRVGGRRAALPPAGPEGAWGAGGDLWRARRRGGWVTPSSPSADAPSAARAGWRPSNQPSMRVNAPTVALFGAWCGPGTGWGWASVCMSALGPSLGIGPVAGGDVAVDVLERGVLGSEVAAATAAATSWRSGRNSGWSSGLAASAAGPVVAGGWAPSRGLVKSWQQRKHRWAMVESRTRAHRRVPTCEMAPWTISPHATVPETSAPSLPPIQARSPWRAVSASCSSVRQGHGGAGADAAGAARSRCRRCWLGSRHGAGR